MAKKILIPLYGNEVAPRFDLATEILITNLESDSAEEQEKIIVLPQASAEKLCHLILSEGIQVVICSGIEDEYYQYLIWKKIKVLDSVIGNYRSVLQAYNANELEAGSILRN